jgi:hypothetical protein
MAAGKWRGGDGLQVPPEAVSPKDCSILLSTPSTLRTSLNEEDVDEKISDLFQEWLSAFDAVQVASGEEAIARAHSRLTEIETQIANTQGEGMQCLAIKLGLHCFLADQADAPSLQSESAYRDLESLSFEASWARGARFPSVGNTTLMCGSFNQPNKFPSFSPKDQIEEVRKLLRR